MAATGANMDSKNAMTMNMMPYLLVERMIPPYYTVYTSNIYAISATIYFLKRYDHLRLFCRSHIRTNIGGSKPRVGRYSHKNLIIKEEKTSRQNWRNSLKLADLTGVL